MMMRNRGPPAWAMTLAIAAVAMLVAPGTIGDSTSVVPVGEPLHLYFRRDPTQNITYLYFHPPAANDTRPVNDLRYRHVFGPKGTPSSTYIIFFPQDKLSNFLQFEPNMSVSAGFELSLSAPLPLNASNIRARLQIIIELDYERDGSYDARMTAPVEFNADSNRRTIKGAIDVDTGALKRFDGRNGGRVRATITRADDLDVSVVLYCGYAGLNSNIVLPFSKYVYVPVEDGSDGSSLVVYILVGIGIALVIVIIIIAGRKGGKDEGWNEKRGKHGSGPKGGPSR